MSRVGVFWAIVASITWGLLYNIDQKILLKTSPLTMFLVGAIMQTILLLPYAFTQTGHKDISSLILDRNQLGLLFFAEVLCIIAGVAILYAVKNLTAPIASILEISYPFFVAIFYYLLFKGEINTNFWIGAGFIFIGSLLIIR